MKKGGIYSIGGIIILLIAAFIFVLVPAMAGGAQAQRLPPYGYYNGEPIEFAEGSDFYNLANQAVQRMEQQGYSFNEEYSSFYYSLAFTQAFNQVVGPMALRDLTDSTGWLATSSLTDRELINNFYSEAGSYSQALYNATSDEQKRKNQEQVVNGLIAGRSYEDLFGSFQSLGKNKLYGLKASSSEIEFIREMGSDVREFEYVSFEMKTYPEEKTREYAEANKDKFEKYDLSVITADDESGAKDILKRIRNSEITFEDAVTESSTKISGDSESGKITQNLGYQIDSLVKDKAADVKALAPGELSDAPVALANGSWAIFKCNSAKTQSDLSDSSDLDKVSSYIFANERGLVQDYYMAEANDFVASSATGGFNDACAKFGKTKSNIPSFALNYNNTTLLGKTAIDEQSGLTGASTNENFLTTAFKLSEGEVSSPIVITSTNNIVVLRCSSAGEGGTSQEDAPRLIGSEIANADAVVVNSAIQGSSKIKSNSAAFMAAFTGEK